MESLHSSAEGSFLILNYERNFTQTTSGTSIT